MGRGRKKNPEKPVEMGKKLGLTIAEFSKIDGASTTYIYRAIAEGKLTKLADGTLDPTQAGGPWRAGNRQKEGDGAEGSLEIDDIRTTADATRVQAYYKAMLAKIEYDEKIGLIAPVQMMLKRMSGDYSKVRTKMLAIPAEQAPNLILIKNAAEMQQALLKVITAALRPLAEDPTTL